MPQGISAELIADKWNLSREDLDAFSVQSHLRAARATEEGRFEKEILAVTGADGGVFDRDEGVRPDSNVEKLATLKPAFKPDGKVTAGNSSQISDGAAALLIMSEEKANELGLRPRARFHAFALAGVDPVTMLTGPIPATEKVLERAKMSLSDIDLVEINEAFASVVLAWEKEHHPDMTKVNVNGGAIALGHPLGLLRRQADDHAAQRARAHRRPLRPPDDVRGRRHGQRHHHRAPGLTAHGPGKASPGPATTAPRARIASLD